MRGAGTGWRPCNNGAFGAYLAGIEIAMVHGYLGTLIATGITALIAIEVIINIAACNIIHACYGMPLPFSYGGTAMLVMMTVWV